MVRFVVVFMYCMCTFHAADIAREKNVADLLALRGLSYRKWHPKPKLMLPKRCL